MCLYIYVFQYILQTWYTLFRNQVLIQFSEPDLKNNMPRNSALQHAFKCVLENAVLNFGEPVCTHASRTE